MSKDFAVVGDPIAHSLSPKIHLAAYKHLGLDYTYGAHRVGEGELSQFVSGIGSNLSGLSVTMPLKVEAAQLAVEAHLDSTEICNTLVKADFGFTGYNTDIAGIRFALAKCFTEEPLNVAILGSGATARSSIAALSLGGLVQVKVFARDLATASNLVKIGNHLGVEVNLKSLVEYQGGADLTISTLPAGATEGLRIESRQRGWLLQANYQDKDQVFLESFDANRVISGVEMLIGQAIEQVRYFSAGDIDFVSVDREALASVMREAL